MIDSLDLILKMKSRRRTDEVFVSHRLFKQLVDDSQNGRSVSELRLDRPYDSTDYRYCHRARWEGLTFICLTQGPFAS